MTPQNQLAFVIAIKEGDHDALQKVLDQIAIDPAGNTIFPFAASTTTHFARWVVIPGTEEGHYLLVFSSNFDGQSRRKHLEEWFSVNESGFDTILSHCVGYDTGATTQKKVRLLQTKFKSPAAFYIGTRGHSLEDIDRDFKLRDFIRDFVDTQNFKVGEEKQLIDAVKQKVKDSEFNWAMKSSSYPLGYRIKKFFQKWYDFIRLGLIAIIVAIGLAGLVGVPLLFQLGVHAAWLIGWSVLTIWCYYLLLTLRKKEKTDGVSHERISIERAHALGAVEDIYLQNQMTHLVTIKPGQFRAVLSRLALWGIYVLAKHVFNKGTLGGIPSIHFARWVIVDKRLLFFSNFDASWMNYLGDFIDKASLGLTAAWSSTMGFPKTRFLAFGGATMADRFKRWARNLQIPTQVWYSAYPNYSVENINNNAKIRQGLSASLNTDKKRKEWLARL